MGQSYGNRHRSLGTVAPGAAESCSFDPPENAATFERLELNGVVHSYRAEQDDRRFVLGPISLVFCPGELVQAPGFMGQFACTKAL